MASACADNTAPPQAEESARLRSDIGKTACNATNGVYRGTITGVAVVTTELGEAVVYRVTDDEDITRNAPPSNVVLDCTKDRP